MADQPRHTATRPRPEPMGCLPALLRLTWMALGNFGLLLCAAFIAKGAGRTMDVGYFGVAVGLIVIRYVDIMVFGGRTSEGDPATLAHWSRYAAWVAVVAVALWALAKLIAARGWM